ncbi:hypothetical protein ACTXIV_08670 [Psychrobacter celer]|uniref:hypothetical protein n=1 Tax=Psychrobacter celer TaxID=306572 RepID=UPI003FD1DD54
MKRQKQLLITGMGWGLKMRLISNNENLVIQKDAISGRLEIQKKLDYSTKLDEDAIFWDLGRLISFKLIEHSAALMYNEKAVELTFSDNHNTFTEVFAATKEDRDLLLSIYNKNKQGLNQDKPSYQAFTSLPLSMAEKKKVRDDQARTKIIKAYTQIGLLSVISFFAITWSRTYHSSVSNIIWTLGLVFGATALFVLSQVILYKKSRLTQEANLNSPTSSRNPDK